MKPIHEAVKELLPTSIYSTMQKMGQLIVGESRIILKTTVVAQGHTNLVLATGNSQPSFLEALRTITINNWSKLNIL